MNSIGQKIVAALDKALAPPSPADQFVTLARAIIRESGQTLAGKDELKALRQLQTEHDNTQKVINSHTLEQSKFAWLDHLAEIQKQVAKDGDVSRFDGWTRKDFEEDFAAKMTVGKQELQRVFAETAKVSAPIKARLAEVANRLADEHEQAERGAYEKFGLPASPSELVRALRGAATEAMRRGGHPRQSVPYLDI